MIFYFRYTDYVSKNNKELKYNVRDVLLVSRKLLFSMSKNHKDIKIDNVKLFPDELYKYIGKPTPNFLSKCIINNSNYNKENDFYDINRCISISSILFRKEIPLIFVKLDKRTKNLYELIFEELSLRHVLIMKFYIDKIEQLINENKDKYDKYIDLYASELEIIGEEILSLSEEYSFSSLEFFTENINKKHNKQYTCDQVKSLCTAFSAITNIKIPKVYINIDIIALSLYHYFKLRKPVYD